MSTKPEFLAAELEAGCFGPSMVQNELALRVKAAAEIRRLAAVEAERDQLRAEVAEYMAERNQARDLVAQYRAEVEALRRGEFICGKCGLRKDADAGPVPF